MDAEIGVWESEMVYRPAQSAKLDEEVLRGQELLRDISKAFVGTN